MQKHGAASRLRPAGLPSHNVHLVAADAAFIEGCNDVQPELFGGFTVVKEWGHIGRYDRTMEQWRGYYSPPDFLGF